MFTKVHQWALQFSSLLHAVLSVIHAVAPRGDGEPRTVYPLDLYMKMAIQFKINLLKDIYGCGDGAYNQGTS